MSYSLLGTAKILTWQIHEKFLRLRYNLANANIYNVLMNKDMFGFSTLRPSSRKKYLLLILN